MNVFCWRCHSGVRRLYIAEQKSNLKISIITVCFNSEATIRDTIESVITQTYPDIEYIIVDGASKDSTLSIIDEYKDNVSVLISEPDKGIYDAMNKGVTIATGDFIGVLNSDDMFVNKNVIGALVNFLQKNADLDGSYGDLVFVKRNAVNEVTRKYSSRIFSPRTIRFGIMCPHPTLYVKKKLFDEMGLYDTSYLIAADFELITRFIRQGASLGRFPSVMVKMREGGVSTSGFWQRVSQNFELVRACRKNRIYTNILMIGMKIPYKLAGYLGVSKYFVP